jgi:hypothetical protein
MDAKTEIAICLGRGAVPLSTSNKQQETELLRFGTNLCVDPNGPNVPTGLALLFTVLEKGQMLTSAFSFCAMVMITSQ